MKDTIVQPVDHFNSSDHRSWTQRYFYNFKWYEEGGPIFLMLGGEGPEDGSWTVAEDLPFLLWAMKFKAAVYDIEHRFYGESRPFPTQSTENLKYLSSRQAIEDIANFIRTINNKKGYKSPKWIVFGGSYSGNLALWSREKHPELIVGAVGSSAPVEAKLDFHEYLKVVEASLRYHDFWCPKYVSKGFDEMSRLIWIPEGRTILSDIFKLQPRLDNITIRYKDVAQFFQAIYGNFQGAVQYNRDNVGSYAAKGGVKDLCKIMSNETMKPLDSLSAVNAYMTELYTGLPFKYTDIDYDGMIEFLKDEKYDKTGSSAASRSWTWQTCTEFGYFQSTDSGRGIFGSLTPSSLFIDTCTDVFGKDYKVMQIQDSVLSTNRFYGGRDRFTATNVVMPNGGLDPWSALGIKSSNDPSAVPYIIEGTSHCSDMYPINPTDTPELNISRMITENNIRRWISGMPIVQIPKKQSFGPRKPQPMKAFVSAIKKLSHGEYNKQKWANDPRTTGFPKVVMGRPVHGFLPNPTQEEASNPNSSKVIRGTIIQPVDNFDPTNPAVFEQRYWMNTQYYLPGGPQFLFIGGEGPVPDNPKWLTNENIPIMRSAKKFNAAVFLLEHRYYGNSRPTKDQSRFNLRWLSSRQSLTDIARFILTMNIEQNYSSPRWVTFGGSYAGALSAWFRQQYPELTVGAIASSAPIEVKPDFFEYLIVTQNSLNWYNQTCASNVKKAFDQIFQLLLTPQGRVQLSDLFSLDPRWRNDTKVTTLGIQYFFQNIYSNFQGAVQYNKDNSGGYTTGGGIEQVCQLMLNEKRTLVQRVADVNEYMAKFYTGSFVSTDNSYTNFLHYLRDREFGDSSAMRSWAYQTCTEFGYFQSTDIGENAFGDLTPLSFFVNLCEDVFQIPSKKVFEAIRTTQKHYGGKEYFNATNVVFINGKIDPWHALGEYRTTDTVKSILIEGTAHCADMYPPGPHDANGLASARQLIDDSIAVWLNGSRIASSTATATTETSIPVPKASQGIAASYLLLTAITAWIVLF